MRRTPARKLKIELHQSGSEQKESLSRYLLNPAIVLGFLTALLYFHGQAFHSGYLSYWGLSNQLFPLSFEDTLIRGGWIYILFVLNNWFYLLAGIAYIILIYVLVFLLLVKKPASFIYKLIHTKKINNGQKFILKEVSNIIFKLLIAFFIFLIIPLVMSWANGKGRSIALKEHQNIQEGKIASTKNVFISYLDGESQEKEIFGTMLQASSFMVAVYIESGEVLELSASRIISMHQKAPKMTQ